MTKMRYDVFQASQFVFCKMWYVRISKVELQNAFWLLFMKKAPVSPDEINLNRQGKQRTQNKLSHHKMKRRYSKCLHQKKRQNVTFRDKFLEKVFEMK